MYERRHQPPASRAMFLWRLVKHCLVALILVLGSLVIGMLGYVYLEGHGWQDAFLHAAMLLGGMGLVQVPATTSAKLFAGLYALYADLIFVAAVGIILTPIVHRLLHTFHWEDDETGAG